MTLFQTFDWLIQEAKSRVGQPSPLFFQTLRTGYGWLFSLSSLLLALSSLDTVSVPHWATTANIVFVAIAGSGWGMTHLPITDKKK